MLGVFNPSGNQSAVILSMRASFYTLYIHRQSAVRISAFRAFWGRHTIQLRNGHIRISAECSYCGGVLLLWIATPQNFSMQIFRILPPILRVANCCRTAPQLTI